MFSKLTAAPAVAGILALKLLAVECSEGAEQKLEKDVTVFVTEASGDTVSGVVQEVSPDGGRIQLAGARRTTLEERLRRTPEDTEVTVVLTSGEQIASKLVRVEERSFLLQGTEKSSSQRGGIHRRIDFEKV